MKQFKTFQRGSSGAARVVKYSQGPHELLAFSEQKNYIHVVDARTYEYAERIHLPSVELDDHARLGHESAVQSTLRELMRHPFLSTIGDANNGGTNPWDTYPEGSALPALDLRDCPSPDPLSPQPLEDMVQATNRVLTASQHLPQSSRADRNSSPIISPTRSSSRPLRSTTIAPFLSGSGPNNTVSMVLGGTMEDSAVNVSTAASASSSSITGLDWDPSGRFLYASMERIILEWGVDSASRRCHPHATIL